jgi:mRNA-degrading endonuclease RelE of RelBE toxin-antitoxin system
MASERRYEIRFRKKAHKRYQKLPKAIRLKLDKIVERWVTNPRTKTKGFKPLPGKNEYRCWVGLHHRVEWMVDDDERTVTIVDVGSREGM